MGNAKSIYVQTTQPLQTKSVMLSPIDRTNQILLTHKIANAAFHFMPPRMAVPHRHTTRMGTAKSIYVQTMLPFATHIRHVQTFLLHQSDFENIKN